MFLLIICLLFSSCIAECTDNNFANDPTPWGGANCTRDLDCGGPQAGICDFTKNAGTCVCPKNRAMPNCSYVRMNPGLAGGLNIGLPFAGLGGIGNIAVIGGSRIPYGAGQLVLTLAIYSICFIACIAICCCGEAGTVVTYVIYLILLAAFVCGWAWSIADGAYILQCQYTDANGYWMYN